MRPLTELLRHELEPLARLLGRSCGMAVHFYFWDDRDQVVVGHGRRRAQLSELARQARLTGETQWAPNLLGEGNLSLAAPIISQRRKVGALCLSGKADRVQDLAGLASDACELAARAWERTTERIDITADKLPAAPGLLAELIDVAPIAMAVFSEDLRLIHANAIWLSDHGLTASAAIGRTVVEIEPRAESWVSQFRNALRGERTVAERPMLAAPDGAVAHASLVLAPWRDLGGRIGGVVALHRRTHEEGDAELLRIQRRLEVAIKLGRINVWEMDFSTKAMWGMGLDELFSDNAMGFRDMAADMSQAVHPDDRAATAEQYEAARKAGAPLRAEFRLNRADRDVWVSSTMVHHKDDSGRTASRLGVMVDITERKEGERALREAKEDAERANRAKSTFLATMSHEIRTPLNGVLGMAQAMEGDDLPPTQRERLAVIRHSGEALLTILNDALDLSKIEAGSLELEAIAFDLGEVLFAVAGLFAETAKAKGVALNLDIKGAAGSYLGDPTRIRQVVSNLVSNALKFTTVGEVTIAAMREGEVLVLSVADTGAGLSDEAQARLFSRYSQAEASTARTHGGTGLGLAICKQLAELMGGDVSVRSQVGIGSRFSVRLRIALVGPPASTTEDEPCEAGIAGPVRILAAEDNEINRLVLHTLLGQFGVNPTIVEDGRAAVDAWADGEWDLILMDVQMPLLDGPAATAEIRQREARSGRRRTPILALTANAMSHQVAEYMTCGMDGHVAKPIDARKLMEAIEAALSAPVADDRAQALAG